MLNNRATRFFISFMITAVWMGIIIVAASGEQPPRIPVMLGGIMPEGLIQGFTYLLFVFGMIEIYWLNSRASREKDAFSLHLLPEKENWVLSVEDINQLKLNVQQVERSGRFYLTDLVKKCCTKYRLSKSSSEVLGLTDAQIRIYQSEMESEQSFIRYVAWAIPSVGFIGTVIGIAASLGYTKDASTPEGIEKVTSMLAVAFDTTLVALILSIFLMYAVHHLQRKQDALFLRINDYVIENLINRFYK
ncbi:MAG: MotA/TolQ/ExbB proton channel family protein [Prevotellaceae bacterium]|jgi:chemotaxis protein MotA|nr:MotA/TolQ/ExbB proton channel family protein [Prevotellaceae bacterium]